MAIFALILRLLGYIVQIFSAEKVIAQKAKAQDVANTPDTDKEWIDAANKGEL